MEVDLVALDDGGAGPRGRVLVAGAGPVGLVTALLLRLRGVEVEIVDRNAEAVSQSRATDLHPATLERLEPYGLTDELLQIGQIVRRVVVQRGHREVATIPLGRSGSPFPFALTVPQCTTEGLLQEHLARVGVKVERAVELVGLATHRGGADVTLRSADGARHDRRYDWVIGCDGAGSTVREAAGIGFGGRTSATVSAIADVELDLGVPDDEIHLHLGPGGVHVLPMPVPGYVRLLLDRWPGPVGVEPDPDEFVALAGERLGIPGLRQRGARWTSSFVMHRRIATTFRHERVLLAGDAAHVCPPIGGQGLNTGVGDAVAIATALASVLRGHSPVAALDSVVARRRVVAARTARLAWWAATVNSPRARMVAQTRDALAPAGMRLGTGRLVAAWLAGALDH